MSEDLRFLPLIAEALRAPDARAALLDAFAQIKAEADEAGAKTYPAPFERFMDAVVRKAESGQRLMDADMTDLAGELILALVLGDIEADAPEKQAALDLIQSRPAWREAHAALVAEMETTLASDAAGSIILDRAGEIIATFPLAAVRHGVTARMITAGSYRLRLDSGRVIWRGDLTEQEVLWTHAHPGQPLDLAAASGARREQPTRVFRVLGGELMLRVYPRLESGLIEIVRQSDPGVA